MKPRYYKLLEKCIENGVDEGLARAYKYTEEPDRQRIEQEIYHAITNEIHEWFEFEEFK